MNNRRLNIVVDELGLMLTTEPIGKDEFILPHKAQTDVALAALKKKYGLVFLSC